MTTAEAARYCGFKTTAAIRKALLDGRLVPLGRRGGKGTYMWSRQALDAFVAGARGGISRSDVQVRLRATSEDIMEGTKWIERWKFWIAPKPSRPGVSRRGWVRKRRGRNEVVGKPITTPTTTAVASSQVPETNLLFLSGISGSNRRHSAWENENGRFRYGQ
jgi:hypothetical protein